MSYDVDLMDPETGEVAIVDNHEEGGTYAIGGVPYASLNITYNYSGFFRDHIDKEEGIGWLYGKKAKDTIKRLRKAVESLGSEQDDDYWEATPGNAGHALSVLLKWAEQHPEAVWDGD